MQSYARFLFGIVETASNVGGTLAALFDPYKFASEGLYPLTLPPQGEALAPHIARLYGSALIPIGGLTYTLFWVKRAPSDDKALEPIRNLVLLFLLVGDFGHCFNYLRPLWNKDGKEAEGNKKKNVGGIWVNIGLTLLLAGGRVAYLLGY